MIWQVHGQVEQVCVIYHSFFSIPKLLKLLLFLLIGENETKLQSVYIAFRSVGA